MSQYLSVICHEAPDMTRDEIKDRAEELFPYRMGMNNHNDIYYMGLACHLFHHHRYQFEIENSQFRLHSPRLVFDSNGQNYFLMGRHQIRHYPHLTIVLNPKKTHQLLLLIAI